MHYMYVARSITPDVQISPNGIAGSLPASMTKGNDYSYTFSNITLNPNWVNKNLRAIVILINNDNDHVYNSVHTKFPLGILSLADETKQATLFPNPATQQTTVIFTLQKTQKAGLKIYDMVGRIVYEQPEEQRPPGEQKIVLPIYGIAPGSYFVNIITGDEIITLPLVISSK
jgi:hypothetical protein